MFYKKLFSVLNPYSGVSFTRQLSKDNGYDWSNSEQANYEMTDEGGVVVSSGDLVNNNTHFSLSVPQVDTVGLIGTYLLLIRLTKDDDSTFNEVIAEYRLTYKNSTP